EGAAQRRAAERRALRGHAEHGERAARLLARYRGQQHALGRRAEERLPGAAERAEQHHLPQPGFAGQHECGEGALGEAVEGVGGDHHPVPGSRSASAPPISRNTTSGTVREAATSPTSPPSSPASSTANAAAMIEPFAPRPVTTAAAVSRE